MYNYDPLHGIFVVPDLELLSYLELLSHISNCCSLFVIAVPYLELTQLIWNCGIFSGISLPYLESLSII